MMRCTNNNLREQEVISVKLSNNFLSSFYLVSNRRKLAEECYDWIQLYLMECGVMFFFKRILQNMTK